MICQRGEIGPWGLGDGYEKEPLAKINKAQRQTLLSDNVFERYKKVNLRDVYPQLC